MELLYVAHVALHLTNVMRVRSNGLSQCHYVYWQGHGWP